MPISALGSHCAPWRRVARSVGGERNGVVVRFLLDEQLNIVDRAALPDSVSRWRWSSFRYLR